MQAAIGYGMIVIGTIITLLPVLAWLKVITPKEAQLTESTSKWDVLLLLLQKLPWTAIVGLLLVFAGLLVTGVIDLPK